MAPVISNFSPKTQLNTDDFPQQQQQQWLLSTTKKTPKQTNHLRYRILLDNYFSPLLNPSNSHVSTLSTSFPSIMPTRQTITTHKAASTSQRISDYFDKKSHTRTTSGNSSSTLGSGNISSGSAEGSNKGNSQKGSPSKSSPKPNQSTSHPKKDILNNDSPTNVPQLSINKSTATTPKPSSKASSPPKNPSKANNNITSSIHHEGNDTSDGEAPKFFPGNSNQRKPSGLSSSEDDKVAGKQPGAIKDGWDDSDDDDSDFVISKAVDKAMDSGTRDKGSRKSQLDGSVEVGLGPRKSRRGGGKGRGGGLSSSSSESDIHGDYEMPLEKPVTKTLKIKHTAKRRKGVHRHVESTDDENETDFNEEKNEYDTTMGNDEEEAPVAETENYDEDHTQYDDEEQGHTFDTDHDEDDKEHDSEQYEANAAEDSEGDKEGYGEGDNEDDSDGENEGNSDGENEGYNDDENEGDSDGNHEGDSDEEKAGDNDDDDEGDSDGDEEGDNDAAQEGDNNAMAADELASDENPPSLDTNWSFEFQPKDKVDRFQIDAIVGCLATAVRSVDPTAYIVSWNNASTKRIWSTSTVPTTDAAMQNFVEDPHTSSVGTFGRLYGRLRFMTTMSLAEIKQNPEFGAWIRAQGLFLDISDIPCTRPKLLGFFDRKLPHMSRIHIFKHYLQKTYNISMPFQIFSQTIKASASSDVKCYAYVLKADPKHAATILDELSQVKPRETLRFFEWEDFRDNMEQDDKTKIITDMTSFARNHASFVFTGIAKNEYMRMKPVKRTKENHKDKPMSSLQQAHWEAENEKDLAYSKVRCLTYMQQVFIDSDQQRIFKRIDGPYENQIEVTFAKSYFTQVRDIEKLFIGILASKMTDLSKSKCFSPWPVPLTPDSLASTWSPPKAMKQVNNPYRKSSPPVEYSLTKNSKLSYKDASTLGRRQIDIPMTLVVQEQKSTIPNQASTATTSDTTLTATTTKTASELKQESAFWADIQEAQKQFQLQYDARLLKLEIATSKLNIALARIEKESKAAHQSITLEVKAKYTQITKVLDQQTAFQKSEAALSKKMLAKILKKLNNGPDSDDDDYEEEDTNMQHSTHSKSIKPGSSRTNHPKDQNNIIHQRSRTSKRVAARVQ